MRDAAPQIPERLGFLDRLMRDRHSCRAFLPEPLPRAQIEQILETAQRAASWSNTQPWWLHLVSGAPLEAIRAELYELAGTQPHEAPEIDWPREIRGAHRDRRRECGWGLYNAVGVQKGDREGSGRQARENFRFFGAPHVALVTCDEALGTAGVMDCGSWVYAFLLAAEAAGIGAVAQAALAGQPAVWRKHLDIPDHHVIICGMSFGHEDRTHPANAFRTTRVPIDEIVTWVG